ncbi:hypothetical protein [Weissella paramesenteroides]|uniref:hypothetical protein n=1 Tax=Weissella paramesenteroides TaxID=1249 RepID=UPI002E7B8CD9|nr:hypothetical protein [Weissella paramesenteroides]WPQ67386.1 hypothetical protein QRX23_06295 [Weissella paramesenteroides]
MANEREEKIKKLEKLPEADLNLVVGGLKLGFYTEPQAEIDFNEDNSEYRVIKVRVKKEKELITEDEFLAALETVQIQQGLLSF